MAMHIKTHVEISQSKIIELENADICNIKALFAQISKLNSTGKALANGKLVGRNKLIRELDALACYAYTLREFRDLVNGKGNFDGDGVTIEKNTRKLLPEDFAEDIEAGDIAI